MEAAIPLKIAIAIGIAAVAVACQNGRATGAEEGGALEVRLVSAVSEVFLSEPLSVGVVITNRGDVSIEALPKPDIQRESIRIHATPVGGGATFDFWPAVKRKRFPADISLAPGATLTTWIDVGLPATGWFPPAPGDWQIVASYVWQGQTTDSRPLRIHVREGADADERAARELFQQLRSVRAFRGGSSAREAAVVEEIVETYPPTAPARYARLYHALARTGRVLQGRTYVRPGCSEAVPLLRRSLLELPDPLSALVALVDLRACGGAPIDPTVLADRYFSARNDLAALPGLREHFLDQLGP